MDYLNQTADQQNMSLQYSNETSTTVNPQSYTVSDKLRIIQFAEQNGNHAAECEFGVSKSNARLW